MRAKMTLGALVAIALAIAFVVAASACSGASENNPAPTALDWDGGNWDEVNWK